MKKKPIFKLDDEEKEISDSFDSGEWESVSDLKAEKAKARKAAVNYLEKKAEVNVKISMSDLQFIKQKAAFEGLSYQALIASVLHKYAAGHLNTE